MISPLEVAAVRCTASEKAACRRRGSSKTKGIEDCRCNIRLARLRVERDRELDLGQRTVPDELTAESTTRRPGDVMVNTDTPPRRRDLWSFAGMGSMYDAVREFCRSASVSIECSVYSAQKWECWYVRGQAMRDDEGR